VITCFIHRSRKIGEIGIKSNIEDCQRLALFMPQIHRLLTTMFFVKKTTFSLDIFEFKALKNFEKFYSICESMALI